MSGEQNVTSTPMPPRPEVSLQPRPEVAAPKPFVFPEPVRTRLSNGLSVLTYDVPGQYILAVRLVVPTRLATEPRDKEGVAVLMARTLDEGTDEHDATEFARLLERSGVAFGAGFGDSGLSVEVDVAKGRLDTALDLMHQALTRPSFPEREVARLVRQRLAEIEQERAVAAGRAARELIATYYASSDRLSRPTAGGLETVPGLTRDDVIAFHATLDPATATIVVAGDLDGLDVVAAIERTLGTWTSRSAGGDESLSAPTVLAVQTQGRVSPDRARVVIVDRPGSVQTELAVACPGPERVDPATWAPYPVLSFVMGGSPNARLDAVLREEKGYTYGVRAGFRPRRGGGMFVTQGSVRADATVDSVRLVVEILDGARDGFRDEEVAAGVDFLTRASASRYATAEDIAGEAGSLAFDGLSTSFLTETLAAVSALDADRVGQAWRESVDGRWTVILVGDASLFRAGIEALDIGAVTVVPA